MYMGNKINAGQTSVALFRSFGYTFNFDDVNYLIKLCSIKIRQGNVIVTTNKRSKSYIKLRDSIQTRFTENFNAMFNIP